MYTRDYVLRLIERFGRALIALRNRILGRAVEAADVRAELEDLAQQAGLDLDVARQLDAGMLIMWLAPTGEVDPPRFWLLAELLYLTGLQAHQSGAGDRGRGDLGRAQALFARLPGESTPSPDFATAQQRSEEIAQLLRDR
jgi:hypothetical protein